MTKKEVIDELEKELAFINGHPFRDDEQYGYAAGLSYALGIVKRLGEE